MNIDRHPLVPSPTIVVGLDDAEPSASAADLQFAAAEALARGGGLRIVHGSASSSPAGIIGSYVTQERMHHGDRLLVAASRILHGLTGGEVEIATLNSTDLGVDALLAESRWADRIVLVRTPASASDAPRAHATIRTLAGRAGCPVTIVPAADGRDHSRDGVAVALADRSTSREMVLVAAGEAARRGVPLTVMQVREAPDEHPALAGHFRRSQMEGADTGFVAAGSLSESLAAVAKDYPNVEVRVSLVRGSVTDALVDMTRHSVLLVIARNGAPRSSGPGLGAVTDSLVGLALCPVMVMSSATHDFVEMTPAEAALIGH